MSVKLDGGLITSTGVFFGTPSCAYCSGTVAVAGGTRDFAGADGTMKVSCDYDVTPAECTYVYKLTTP
jgi:hypothetical protein